jgi:hypothetical protein
MKIAMSLIHLISLFVSLMVLPLSLSARENFKEYRRDQWDFDLGTDYFYSNANHVDYSSGRQNLDSGHLYQLIDSYFRTRFVPKRSMSYFAWANVANVESKNGTYVRTNSVFSQAGFGLDFQMYSGAFDLIPELAAVFPLQKLDPTSDIVAANEGVMEFQTRVNLQKDLRLMQIYSWLGFNYRGEGRSYLMPWGVGLRLNTGSFRWGAELFGFTSVSDDTNNDVVRKTYIDNVQGGSLKFYSKNPALIDSQAYVFWKMTKAFSIQANGGLTVAGVNTAAGFHVGGFLRYTFDLTDGYVQPPEPEIIDSPVPRGRSEMYDDSLSSEKKLREFREATDDGIDQQIFKPRPTKKPKKKRPVDLQKQLDNTEFQIELRSKRKGE